MNSKMYKAAMEGDHEFLSSVNHEFLSCATRSHKNTAVHIASRLGHELFVEKALGVCPSLRFQQNERGDTPLHVAARAGHACIVDLLIGKPLLGKNEGMVRSESTSSRSMKEVEDVEAGPSMKRSTREVKEGEAGSELLRMRNRENSTALHEALRKLHEGVALSLLLADFGLASFVNNSNESPLFLAAKSGLIRVLQAIFSYGPPFTGDGPHERTPLHAAALTKSSACTEIIIRYMPEAINGVDEFGRTALHYAVTEYSTEIVRLLLKKDVSSAYIADNEGTSPLLIAASAGHTLAVRAILDYCPDAIELVDKSGKNAVHLAVENISLKEFRRLLKLPVVRQVLDEPDHNGNTPLHLATKRDRLMIVKELVGTKCVDLRTTNKGGLTALDICESEWELAYQQKMLWYFLIKHGASRAGRYLLKGRTKVVLAQHPGADVKQLANTLSVIATLLTTLTFTAAFTIPGGYSDDGLAIHAKKASFKAFVFFDTVAMCCSLTILSLLIWGMMGDQAFLIQTVKYSMRLLFVSYTATLAAFITGIYVVLSTDLLWLCIIVIILAYGFNSLSGILTLLSLTKDFSPFPVDQGWA